MRLLPTLLLFAAAMLTAQEGRPLVAILPLKMEGKPTQGDISDMMNSAVAKAVTESKAFQLVERSQVQALLKEGRLQQSGLVDDEGAVKLGKQLGVRSVILGSYIQGTSNYDVSLTLSLRLVDVENGAVSKTWMESARRPDLGETILALSERLRNSMAKFVQQSAKPLPSREVLVVLQLGTVTRTHRAQTQAQPETLNAFGETLESYAFVQDLIGQELKRRGAAPRFRLVTPGASPATLDAADVRGATHLIWAKLDRHAKSHTLSRDAENSATVALQVIQLPQNTVVATRTISTGIVKAELTNALTSFNWILSDRLRRELPALSMGFGDGLGDMQPEGPSLR